MWLSEGLGVELCSSVTFLMLSRPSGSYLGVMEVSRVKLSASWGKPCAHTEAVSPVNHNSPNAQKHSTVPEGRAATFSWWHQSLNILIRPERERQTGDLVTTQHDNKYSIMSPGDQIWCRCARVNYTWNPDYPKSGNLSSELKQNPDRKWTIKYAVCADDKHA